MSLRFKTLLFFFVLVVFATVFLVGVHRLIVFPRFERLERIQAREDLERVVKTLRREVEHLRLMTMDYANWDDTYRFVQDHNPEYVESNLIADTYSDTELNLVLISDQNSEIVWEGYCTNLDDPEIEILSATFEAQLRDHGLLSMDHGMQEVQGIILTSKGPMVICSAPVLTSTDEGPVMGRMVMGRALSERRAASISGQTMVQADLHTAGLAETSSAAPWATDLLLANRSSYLDTSDPEFLRVGQVLADMRGNPALLVSCTIPRTVFREGRLAVRYANLAAILLSGCFLVAVMLGLEHSIVSRIHKLSTRVSELGDSCQLDGRVDVRGNDELAQLERDINAMLNQRQTAESALLESEQKYRGFFNDAQVGLCRTRINDGKVLEANQRMAELLGFKDTESLLNQVSANDLYVDQEERTKMLDLLLRDRRVTSHTVRLRRQDGRKIWVRFSAHLSTDRTCLEAAVIDISEQKNAEEELRQSIIQMERFNRLAIGREKRMVELKQEVNKLSELLGRKAPYGSRDAEEGERFAAPVSGGDA